MLFDISSFNEEFHSNVTLNYLNETDFISLSHVVVNLDKLKSDNCVDIIKPFQTPCQ